MCSHLSAIRRRQCPLPPPDGRKPPNKSLLRTNKPKACQKLIVRRAKIPGINAFQRLITTKLTIPTAITARKVTLTARITQYFFKLTSTASVFAVNGLQPASQVQNGVPFPGQERIQANTRFLAEILETPPL